MLKNYFKTAWRNLVKDKQFSFLNLLGLSTGLACVLLIYLWVTDEMSVDKFNANDSRLYEVLKKNSDGAGTIVIGKNTQGLLAASMAKDLPEVAYATAVRKQRKPGILSLGDKKIKVFPQFASKDFLEVFSYPIIDGNKRDVLTNISGIALSDAVALKLFNTTNVTGKTIQFDLKDESDDFTNVYTITGVFKSPPANASNQFDVLMPFDLYARKKAGGPGDITFWGSNMASTFILLKPNTDIARFNNKIKDYTRAKIGILYAGQGLQEFRGEVLRTKIF